MRAFVTGGSGFVGRNLIRRIRPEVERVRALARSEESARAVESLGAKPVDGDLDSIEAMADAMADCSVVLHAAAKTDEWGSRAAFEHVNVTGTQQVIEAARRAAVDRVVHVSTEAVLTDGSAHRGVDETHPIPATPKTLYGETKARAERLVLEADDDALTTVAVRPPTVWGPDDTSVGAKFAAAVEDGRFAWIDGGHYPVSTAHVENVVEGLWQAAITDGVGGEAYFVTDGDAIEFREFLTELLAARDLEAADRSIPRPLAKLLAIASEEAWRRLGLGGTPPITRAYVYLFGLPMTIDDSKARRELGYDPPVDRASGLERLGRADAVD